VSTFGTTVVGGSEDNPSLNWVWQKATTTPASNGTLTSVNVSCRRNPSGPANPTICAAIYSDSGGAPSTRLGQNVVGVTVGDSASWVSIAVSATIVAGVQYYFCLNMPGNLSGPGDPDALVAFDASGGTELWYADHSGAPTTFPATAPGGLSTASERWSVYGIYTPDAAPPPVLQVPRRIYVLP